MKFNKKAVIAVILVGAMLLSSCANDNKKKTKRKKSKETKTYEEIYTDSDIQEKVRAKDVEERTFFDYDCKVIRSNNKYNNGRYILFDSEEEASEFYDEAIDSYIYGETTSGDNYVIGNEYGVCDASIEIMIMKSHNVVFILEVSISGDWCGPDSEPSTTHWLSERDIEKIAEDWK